MNYPIENFSWEKNISQMFGVNREFYRKYLNIPSHNGLDFWFPNSPKNGYGQKILATHNGTITRLNYETKWKTNGNGVYLLDEEGKYHTLYWHLSEIMVVIGQKIKAGDLLGLAGNTGLCRPAPTQQYPYNGVHLHYGKYVYGKGFIDPAIDLIIVSAPDIIGDKLPIYFGRDLFLGRRGDDVAWLQTVLKLELDDKVDFEPTGYFGFKTRSAVKKLQEKYYISPILGYCGTKTRKLLNGRWSKFNY